MMKVSCAKCGRALCVALTTREVESGEVARRLCPGRCIGEGSSLSEKTQTKRREVGAETQAERSSRLSAIAGNESWVDRKGKAGRPKKPVQPAWSSSSDSDYRPLPPRPKLWERYEEAELRAGLAEYRALSVSAAELGRRWRCAPQDIYELDLNWRAPQAKPKPPPKPKPKKKTRPRNYQSHPVTQAQRERVIELRKLGYTYAQIMADPEVHIRQSSISKIIAKAGLMDLGAKKSMGSKRAKRTPDLVAQIMALRQSGASLRSVAKELGISLQMVWHVTQEAKGA